jgi:hypothetical protein
LKWKAFCSTALFFVALKKRPKEALFEAYKKNAGQKMVQRKAGLGT